ncbi:ABC-2 type transporter [Halothece sp. PCC 7418]|uniref:ABC transporter permease n=1 Tax=Halothece sp. (strain PCC 7418) TaxID=65093 RepID=UPI0002A07C76|nr:ABC transporter permease [Halothece sp. PCC 7418]AFZ44800.1 ABC-2 type transporter [Halothece sp. PCC 7418]
MKYWRETIAVAQRILLELGRRRRSLIFWGIFPITILLLNGVILADRANLSTAEAFTNAAPVTLVGAALFFSCLGGSVATVVAEREQHTLKRLFLSPLSGFSYFLGIFVAHACIGLGQGILVYCVGAFLGVRIEQHLLLGLLVILMSISAYVGLGFILGTQLARRTEDVNALVAAFGVPLLILGGTFLPASLFPESLLKIAAFNPIYHMNEALLGLWAQGEPLSDLQSHLGFLVVFTPLMMVGGWLSYQGMLRRERRL